VVEAHGLRFEAEAPSGRRNRIGTVLVSRPDPDEEVDIAHRDVEPSPEHHAG
jgi:hypothetical protein